MRLVILLSFGLVLRLAAFAQTSSPANSATPGVLGTAVPAPAAMGVIGVSGGFGVALPGSAVTGVPYSAEQVTEHVQTLADGTHITQPAQTTKFYRDSLGRTRTERTFPAPPGARANGAPDPPSFIEIADPVAGVRYTLEPRNHTAHKLSVPPLPPPPPNSAARLASPSSTAILTLQSPSALSSGVVPAARAVIPTPAPSIPDSQRPQSSRESLGTQTIEGVLAEGLRTTVTYPIGAVGNDRPITTSTETWTSPELKMNVLSKTSDPRNGESTTRLINISRAEPDTSLFQVPPDYQIIEPETRAPVR